MTRIATSYRRPLGTGQYATVIATLPDGREVTIDTQYAAVLPRGNHVPTVHAPNAGPWDTGMGCPQLTQMGGRCTCPANADIMAMADALVAEARTIGHPEVEAQERLRRRRSGSVWRRSAPSTPRTTRIATVRAGARGASPTALATAPPRRRAEP